MPVARGLPASTGYMCAVVARLVDLDPDARVTVGQLADATGVNREAARWCLNRLQDSLLADAVPGPALGPLQGRAPRLWALTESGRGQADTILRGRRVYQQRFRGRSA